VNGEQVKNNLVIIFAKTPEIGKVKTRLAKDLGDEKAKEVYEEILHNLVRSLSLSNAFDLCLYISGDSDYFTHHFPRVVVKEQSSGDLGKRMHTAFSSELKEYEKVIVIGSDCPEISIELLEETFQAFNQVVLGPATDGGYYLIGLSRPVQIFDNIEWSTSTVFEKTIKKINEQQLECILLGKKPDIDTIDDYRYYKEKGLVS